MLRALVETLREETRPAGSRFELAAEERTNLPKVEHLGRQSRRLPFLEAAEVLAGFVVTPGGD